MITDYRQLSEQKLCVQNGGTKRKDIGVLDTTDPACAPCTNVLLLILDKKSIFPLELQVRGKSGPLHLLNNVHNFQQQLIITFFLSFI